MQFLEPTLNSASTSTGHVSCPTPLPVRNNPKIGKTILDSSEIDTTGLKSVESVICSSHHLCNTAKLSTLAVKLSRDAFFGDKILARCTVAGEREYPGLPITELEQLKRVLLMQLPQFWMTPMQFEPIWKHCCEAIGQACKRLRKGMSV